MLSRRAISTVLLVPIAIALAACSTTTKGQGSPGGPDIPTLSAPPTNVPSLAAAMQRGTNSITSAHLAVDITVAGQRVQGAGDEALAEGKLTALSLSETVGGLGTLQVRIVGEETFVALPSSLNKTGKPWAVVSADSTNPVIKSLDTTIKTARQAVSPNTASTFAKTAKSLRLVGSEQVNGSAASHYSIAVDVSKLPAAYPGRDSLISAGIKTLPAELWIDEHGRPVRLSEKFSAQRQVISTVLNLSNFNATLNITAPPASQVSTS